MSMSEKRYFNIYASRHTIGEKNNSTILFEALDKFGVEDEAVKSFIETQGVSVKNIASDKNFLYSLILRSLSEFHIGRNASLKVKETLHQAEILYQKELYEACLELLAKAKEQAHKYELYPLIVEASIWETRCHIKLSNYAPLKDLLADSTEALALVDNLYAFMNLYYKMLDLNAQFRKGILVSTSSLEEEMKHPFLSDESIALTTRAKIYFWHTHVIFHRSNKDKYSELSSLERLLQLMESDEDYLQEYPYEYAEVLQRILVLNHLSSDDQFNKLLQHYGSLPTRLLGIKSNSRLENQTAVMIDLHELLRWIELNDTKNLSAKLALVEPQSKDHLKVLTESGRIFYSYVLALSFFRVNKYLKAANLSKNITHKFSDKISPSYYYTNFILLCMTFTALNDWKEVRNTAELGIKYLKKIQNQSSIILQILNKFREEADQAKNTSKQKMKVVFLPLMEEIEKNEEEELPFLPFLSWIKEPI